MSTTVNDVIATIKDHRGGEIPADTELPDELLVLEIERLRAENTFLKSFLQSHSLKMDGQHSWRFMGGWPMASAKGPTPDHAVRHAMELVAESKGTQ